MNIERHILGIVPIHRKQCAKVEEGDIDQVKKIATDMQFLIEHGDWGGKNVFALHHAQVESEDPFNLFVIKRSVVGAKENEIVLICNPRIIERDDYQLLNEGCLSFPFRKDKKVRRALSVKVSYDVITNDNKLEHKEEETRGIMAQIFQHEVLHGAGQHIYQ